MRLLLPICWLVGHDRPETEDKPGWFTTKCQRCGRDFGKAYWWQRLPHKIARRLVGAANWLVGESEDQPWGFYGFARINNVEYIAKTHVESLLRQYEQDGMPEPSLKSLISKEGWVSINDVGGEQFLDMINESLEAEANRREREATMKLINGKDSEHDIPSKDEES